MLFVMGLAPFSPSKWPNSANIVVSSSSVSFRILVICFEVYKHRHGGNRETLKFCSVFKKHDFLAEINSIRVKTFN